MYLTFSATKKGGHSVCLLQIANACTWLCIKIKLWYKVKCTYRIGVKLTFEISALNYHNLCLEAGVGFCRKIYSYLFNQYNVVQTPRGYIGWWRRVPMPSFVQECDLRVTTSIEWTLDSGSQTPEAEAFSKHYVIILRILSGLLNISTVCCTDA